MRKITSILSMFLLIAGWNTASAQFAFKKLKAVGDRVTDVSQLQNGHYYVFKNQSKGKYIKLDKETMQFKNDNQLTEGDNSDGLAVFKLHVDESTGTKLYSFESARDGYYMPQVRIDATANATDVTSASAAKFVISATDKNNKTKENCWAIKNSTDDAYFDMQNDQFVGWKGTEAQTWYEINEVTVSEEETDLQIVYKVVEKTNGKVFSTAYGIAKSGDTYSYTAPANKSDYLTLTKEPENKIITESNMTFEYEYTGTAPFNVGQWYSLRIKHDDRVLRAIAEENNLYVNTEPNSKLEAIANTYPNFLNALWRIEESGTGVKIYNKAVGKYLQANGYSSSNANVSNRATFDNTGTVFYVKSFNGSFGFYTGSDYLNASCSSSTGANTRLGVWYANGDGSTFYCEKTNDDLLALGKTAFANTPDVYSYTNNNALIKGGNYSGSNSSAAAATTLDGLFEIGAKVPSEVCPDPNAYYLIRNVNGGELGRANYENGGVTVDPENDRFKYLSTSHMTCNTVGQNVSDQTLKRVKGKSDLLPLLWKFVKVEGQDGQYYLQNANMNACVNFNVVPTTANEATQKTAFTFEATNMTYDNWQYYATNDGVSMFLMKTADGAKWLNALNGAKAEGVADYANHNADAGNYWQFIKVTEVPLTIAANDYTTLCLPFNVKLPEGSAVKAYYASAAAGAVLKLTEITGIIPANQGVILQNTNESEVANINLAITTEETTTLTGNQLRGVTAKREGYTAKQNYVLAIGNKGIGFYKANFTAIAANKAYLPSENITNAQGVMMAFSFGNEVTGIDNVNTAAPAAKKYYDLQGRRVLYPAKGIFVTEDGQKVLFK